MTIMITCVVLLTIMYNDAVLCP